MARTINRLKAMFVERKPAAGAYPDGGGLYLQVADSGARSWLFRYRFGAAAKGKEYYLGLGAYPTVGLDDARRKAVEYRKLLDRGLNPKTVREAERARSADIAEPQTVTFGDCVREYLGEHEAKWRNAKHRAQWQATLTTHARSLTNLPVADINTDHVKAVLQPIWSTTPETASRLRGRVEAILDFAKVNGYRIGDNPARWRGHLSLLLPARGQIRSVKHHAALPYAKVPAFTAELSKMPGMGALALRFTILTAARTGEALGATWAEIDLERAVWSVPAERMKGKREHRVPLPAPALALLRSIDKGQGLLFTTPRGRPLSNMTLLAVLRRMKVDATTHGFRSSFRDWVGEDTDFPGELAELALAHRVGDATERAYRRADGFKKRGELMEAWAAYCLGAAHAQG